MIRHREIPRSFDIEILFRNHLSVEKIESLSLLVRIVAKYMTVDRSILDKRADKHIGLGLICQAIKWGLISEYQLEDKSYIYSLGAVGIIFANKAGYRVGILPIDASLALRNRILSLNYYLCNNAFDLSDDFVADPKMGYVVCNNTSSTNASICYFDSISLSSIKQQVATLFKKTRFRNTVLHLEYHLVENSIFSINPNIEGSLYTHLTNSQICEED